MSKDIAVIQAIHGVAAGYFKARGFEWEVERRGETKLGYWRMKLHSREVTTPYPKRIVMLPGFGDTPMSWYPVLSLMKPWLRNHYDELVLFDFPGFRGFLSRYSAFSTMDLLVQATHDALDRLAPDCVMGHSLGGWLTAAYAASCGEGKRPVSSPAFYKGPSRIVLISPSGVFPSLQVKEHWGNLFKRAAREGFHVIRPHLFAKEPYWFKKIVGEFSQFIDRDDIVQFIESVRDDHTLENRAHQISSETWLVWGEKDTLISSTFSEAWVECLQAPGSKLPQPPEVVLLKRSGHSPHFEQTVSLAGILGRIVSGKKEFPSWGGRWWKRVPSHGAS